MKTRKWESRTSKLWSPSCILSEY